MKQFSILLCSFALCLTTYAEWFQVDSVISYNQIVAYRPNESANTIKIRIRNLENIEDIRMDRSKVLLSGSSSLQLAKDILEGQLVWIDELEESSGIFVGNVFPSYEQIVRGYAKQRMVGGQTVPADVKAKIQDIYRRMISNLSTTSFYEDEALFRKAFARASGAGEIAEKDQSNNDVSSSVFFGGKSYFTYEADCYTHEYTKGIFAYEALSWFKEEGQFLPADIQRMFIAWLSQYQTAQDQRAQALEMKIRDLTVRYKLYKDFLFDD